MRREEAPSRARNPDWQQRMTGLQGQQGGPFLNGASSRSSVRAPPGTRPAIFPDRSRFRAVSTVETLRAASPRSTGTKPAA